MQKELKPFWAKFFNFDLKFGVLLLLLFCIPRFLLVLNANQTANYAYIGLIMLFSAIAPFVFLSKTGRRKIGITKPKNFKWLLFALIIGLTFSFLLYLLGDILYGNTIQNWYNYIGNSYKIPSDIDQQNRLKLFVIMAISGITFSPIGEELFFRGIVHSSIANSIGERKASIIDSGAFALVHISHFGLVFINLHWELLLLPTLIWVASMFILSILFYICRKQNQSILGAIICHAAFNLGMIYCIFYPLLVK